MACGTHGENPRLRPIEIHPQDVPMAIGHLADKQVDTFRVLRIDALAHVGRRLRVQSRSSCLPML